MAKVELVMPKMGESIMEATILKWVKNVGDRVEQDETILEIATDKVDSEIPSPTSGIITEIKFVENTVVEIGKVIAIIETEASVAASPAVAPVAETVVPAPSAAVIETVAAPLVAAASPSIPADDDRFYSPLVKNIAKEENISAAELATIQGSGGNGRVTKKDILDYVRTRSTTAPVPQTAPVQQAPKVEAPKTAAAPAVPAFNFASGDVEIIEMDRMRKLIADHMVMSKQTSPHVTSYVEVDVTNIVKWRDANKGLFEKKYGEKITFTPIFMECVVKALKDFPLVNVSVDGTNIIVKKNLNIGMATALPSGNLIVPVIKNADYLNLAGLTKSVNDLAKRARENKLKPEEIKDGTFTITNVGTFGNVMGTPIINQPQVAILAIGAIRKKPAVLETEYGDVIAVRQMMFLSLSYDHRVVDGALGGSFLKRISDYMEAFDPKTSI